MRMPFRGSERRLSVEKLWLLLTAYHLVGRIERVRGGEITDDESFRIGSGRS
jgi:hypothetical protein